MVNENAKKWVKALRSGKYKQTTCTLQDEEGFCCLGVGCVVFEEETGIPLPTNKNGFYNDGNLSSDFTVVKDWLGLSSDEGRFGTDSSLVKLNDNCGFSFEQIADVIESEPFGLFQKEEE